MPEIQTPVAVALLYPSAGQGDHLREAMKELGAAIVYEALAAAIDRDALEGSGARVVVVNLGADSDDTFDQLYDVLDAGDYHVVFNDAQVSEQLSGWDHARWARNLAAKILSQPEISEPPRPAGAEAVPTPVQTSAFGVPVADRPGQPVALISEPAAALPASERPTVELPVPLELSEPVAQANTAATESPVAPTGAATTAAHDAALSMDGLDFAGLDDFAAAADTTPKQPTVPLVAAAIPAVVTHGTDANFAAELDALFAAADQIQPTPVEPLDTGGFDMSELDLPEDFNLADSGPQAAGSASESLDTLDIPFDSTPASTPVESAPMPPKPLAIAELHAEFPAIFDQLDAAAESVPVAGDSSFKPAQRPAADKADDATPVLSPDWDLAPVDDDAPAAAAPTAFGIEKVSATEYLAPPVEVPMPGQTGAIAESAASTLELMPMEEAVAPPSNYSHETWLDENRPTQKLKVGSGTGVQRVFVLGASIGGPEAVRVFLGALPAGFPVVFILAQHMGEEFVELMSAQLARSIALTVRTPTHGERVGNGEVLIVPTTHRLRIDDEGVITLALLTEKSAYTPSIDQVLRDVADQFGDKAGVIVFSGMAHDAVAGSQYLKSKGGVVWVQDPETCVISSMIDGVREAGVVDFLGSPQQLAAKMLAEYAKV